MELVIEQSRNQRGKNWVARITGTDPRFGFAREFLTGLVVGGMCSYSLTDGLYEVSEPRSLGKTYRHFVMVERDKPMDAAREDVTRAVRAMDAQAVARA